MQEMMKWGNEDTDARPGRVQLSVTARKCRQGCVHPAEIDGNRQNDITGDRFINPEILLLGLNTKAYSARTVFSPSEAVPVTVFGLFVVFGECAPALVRPTSTTENSSLSQPLLSAALGCYSTASICMVSALSTISSAVMKPGWPGSQHDIRSTLASAMSCHPLGSNGFQSQKFPPLQYVDPSSGRRQSWKLFSVHRVHVRGRQREHKCLDCEHTLWPFCNVRFQWKWITERRAAAIQSTVCTGRVQLYSEPSPRAVL